MGHPRRRRNVLRSSRPEPAYRRAFAQSALQRDHKFWQWANPRLLACDTADCGSRSEEHTSELQSRLHLVCRLLLEKKKFFVASTLQNPRWQRPAPGGQFSSYFFFNLESPCLKLMHPRMF